MSLSSYVVSIRTLFCVSHWIACTVALSAFGCRPSSELSMERESNRPPLAAAPIYSVVSSDSSSDSESATHVSRYNNLVSQYNNLVSAAQSALEQSHAYDGRTTATSFTDIPSLLEPREVQTCGEVTIAPGTARRIPYVIPLDWRCMYCQVYVTQDIPELTDPEDYYHVESLPIGFSYYGKLHQGVLLCADVPFTYPREEGDGSNISLITVPLKLMLQIHLAPCEEDSAAGGTLAASNPAPFRLAPCHGDLPVGDTLAVSDAASAPVLSPDRIAFGAAAWQEYFGVDVGEVPQLPDDIIEILNSKSPFLLDEETAYQRVGDNHLLTLIPGTVDGEGFTLSKLGELLLRNHNGRFTNFQGNNKEDPGYNSHGYHYYSKYIKKTTRRNRLSGAPYWLLLPKTILQGSRHKSFSYHKEGLEQYSRYSYQLPRALEVATSLLAHYARHGRARLYALECHSKCWWTFTRCSDLDKKGDPLIVGGFESSGLGVSVSRCDDVRIGVTCVRRL